MKQINVMRKTIGYLIIALPVFPVLFGLIGLETNPENWWNSISATYYTNAKVLMIGMISICAFFFCTYQGYDIFDRVVNIASGVMLYMILLFPCGDSNLEIPEKVGIFLIDRNVSNIIHSISAITAFALFFVNIMFLFTKTDGFPTEKKKQRNIIYFVCASLIPLAGVPLIITANVYEKYHFLVLVGEAISLFACGFAWLVKGGMFSKFND